MERADKRRNIDADGMTQSEECAEFLRKLKAFMDESGWAFANGELAVFKPDTKEELEKRNSLILGAEDCYGDEYLKEKGEFFKTFKVYKDA